jgi:hypothetical protein
LGEQRSRRRKHGCRQGNGCFFQMSDAKHSLVPLLSLGLPR